MHLETSAEESKTPQPRIEVVVVEPLVSCGGEVKLVNFPSVALAWMAILTLEISHQRHPVIFEGLFRTVLTS